MLVARRNNDRYSINAAINCEFNIGFDTTSETCNGCIKIKPCYLSDCLSLTFTGTGAASLNKLNPRAVKFTSNFGFFIGIKRYTRCLFTISKCCIEELYRTVRIQSGCKGYAGVTPE